jgi:hypothetical protein
MQSEKRTDSSALVVVTEDLDSLATYINESHRSCLECSRNAIGHAVEAGELLLKAKALVGHGRFENWIKKFTKLSPRTARAYMQVGKRWPELTKAKRQNAADLTIRDALAELASTSKKLTALPPLASDKAIVDARDHTLRKAVDSAVAAEKKAATWVHFPKGILMVGEGAFPDKSRIVEGKAEEVAPVPPKYEALVAHILDAVRNYVRDLDIGLTVEDACEGLNYAYCQVQDKGDAVLRPGVQASSTEPTVTPEDETLALGVASYLMRLREVSQKIGGEELYAKSPAKLRHNLDLALTDANGSIAGLYTCWSEQKGERP